MDVCACRGRRSVVRGWDGVLDEPGEDVADGRLAGLEAEHAGQDAVLDDAAHALDRRGTVADDEVADARAHDRHHAAGLGDRHGGHGHVRIDVRHRHRGPGSRPVHAAASARQPARALADRQDVARHLVVDDGREARIKAGEVVGRRKAVRLGPDRLVAGGAAVARLDPGQPPDHPVSGLDQPVGGAVQLGILVEDLEALRVEPFRRDLAAVTRQPRLAARSRERVDPVGLGLRGVVLPELDPRMRPAPVVRRSCTAACRRRSSAASCRL